MDGELAAAANGVEPEMIESAGKRGKVVEGAEGAFMHCFGEGVSGMMSSIDEESLSSLSSLFGRWGRWGASGTFERLERSDMRAQKLWRRSIIGC